jgi:hypothetical protein
VAVASFSGVTQPFTSLNGWVLPETYRSGLLVEDRTGTPGRPGVAYAVLTMIPSSEMIVRKTTVFFMPHHFPLEFAV